MRLESFREVTGTSYLQPYDESVVFIGSASAIFYADSYFKRGQCFVLENSSNYSWQINGNINRATSVTLLPEESMDVQYLSTGFIVR
jgi:hypothetical protein